MLGLKEFYNDLKSRISNPLISSFIISWLLINWRIPIALIFYTQDELLADGYNSYIHLVVINFTYLNYLILPIVFSICYTFGFPVLRTLVGAFNTRIFKWSENWNLKIIEDGRIPIVKYLKLRENYKKQQAELQDLIDTESQTKDLLDTLRIDYDNLIASNTNSVVELNKWRTANDYSVLNGRWEYSFMSRLTNEEVTCNLSINNGNLDFGKSKNAPYGGKLLHIKWFYHSPINNRINLVLEVIATNDKGGTIVERFVNQDLNVIGDMNLLEGTEDDTLFIKYKKLN